MVRLLAFLVWTCVLGSSYVRSEETADRSNSNSSTQIASSPTNSETELNVGNIQDVTLPKPDLNTIQVTEATVSSGLEPVKPLAQQTNEDAASVNQASKTEPSATDANLAPVIKTAPVAPMVTQSSAVVNQIPTATLERSVEPVNTVANTIEKVAEVNPIQLAPAATNALESVTTPSNPASSVTIPSTGSTNPSSTRLNATLNEERAAEPINTAANTVEKVSAKNPIPAEPEPKVTDPLSTALDTAFTEIVKPASAVTKPTSLAANSVPIEVNPEILSVTETTNSFPATNIAPVSETPATATETPELIREIVVSAVSEGSAGTTETSEPSGALVKFSANEGALANSSADANATSAALGTAEGGALVNSSAVANATSAALGTAEGGYLVNSSPVANTTSTGITALNTDEEDASSAGFNDTTENQLITSPPPDPRVILQNRIDKDVIRLGAKLQDSIDFYAESRESLNGLLKDINLRHEIAEVALTNLQRILTEIITRPTKKVKLAEVFKKAIGIRDTPIPPVDAGASALV
ncbi:hypothetical protein SNE40_006315 [Patella caerulea]|uniref:Uncharacterized protein n=1 Tax=Patella caerulea TaxID=87958 RepID=A0AAN8JWI2_PATCE